GRLRQVGVGHGGEPDGRGVAEAAAPQFDAPAVVDVRLRRRAVVVPELLVALLDARVVVGERRGPLADGGRGGDAGELRRQVGVGGGAGERDEAAQPKRRLGFAEAALLVGQEIRQRDLVAGFGAEGRVFPVGEEDFIVAERPERPQRRRQRRFEGRHYRIRNALVFIHNGVGQVYERRRGPQPGALRRGQRGVHHGRLQQHGAA